MSIDRAEEIAEAFVACKFDDFVQQAREPFAIVGDTALVRALSARADIACRTTDLREIYAGTRPDAPIWIVIALQHEEEVRQQVAALASEKIVVSARNDLLPYLISFQLQRFASDDFLQAAEGYLPDHIARKPVYAILSTPRSGSSFLCDLLSQAAIGKPREHLRPPAMRLLEFGEGFDLSRFSHHMRVAQGNFRAIGTKVISHFLADLDTKLGDSPSTPWHDIQPRLIYLRRDNRVLQAISGYAAACRGIWHFHDEMERSTALKKAVPYNFGAIHSYLERYALEEQGLAERLVNQPNVLRISYEQHVCGNTNNLMKTMSNFLGIEEDETQVVHGKVRLVMRDNSTRLLVERFEKDYYARFGRNPNTR